MASNPTLLDALRGPFVYVDLVPSASAAASAAAAAASSEKTMGGSSRGSTWGGRMLETAQRTYDPRMLGQAYLAHADKVKNALRISDNILVKETTFPYVCPEPVLVKCSF